MLTRLPRTSSRPIATEKIPNWAAGVVLFYQHCSRDPRHRVRQAAQLLFAFGSAMSLLALFRLGVPLSRTSLNKDSNLEVN